MPYGFPSIDFDRYHREELPKLVADGRGALAGPALRGREPLAFRLEGGGAYTYLPASDGIEIVSGDERADTVIGISKIDWEGMVHDLETPPGLLYGGRIECLRGDAMKLVLWEPALRALYAGRPVFDPYHIELEDRHGAPLDVEHAFHAGDDREDMAHFLRTAGYLFVRDVFRQDEIDAFLAEAAVLRTEAVPGDKLSWWAKDAKGEPLCCRVTRAAAKPNLATLPDDPRLLSLVELADEKLANRGTGEAGVSIIWKTPGMTEGLSDIPWHRDCGMGGHAVMCPVLIASVYLTPANEQTGELKMLPGSWTGSCGFMDPTHPKSPGGAHFRANPGDVSLHYGDVMHAAPPPAPGLDGYRISAVTGFVKPGTKPHRGSHYNEVLHGREDGQVEHLEKVAGRASEDS